MAQVLKPTPVAQVDASSRIQARSGGKTIRFLGFFIRFGFPESAFRFLHLKSTPRGTKSTTAVASKVRSARHPKVDF
jgi:ribosomal protein L14